MTIFPGQNGQPEPTQPAGDPMSLLAAPPSGVEAPAPTAKTKRPVLTLVLGGVVLAALGFGGGVLTGRATAPEPAAMAWGPGGQAGQGEFPAPSSMPDAGERTTMGAVTQGTVKSVDGDTITLETDDGEVTVKVTDSTSVTLSGAASDLTAGDQVTVMGEQADGSIEAVGISEGELGQMRMGGFGGNFGGQAPSGAPTN